MIDLIECIHFYDIPQSMYVFNTVAVKHISGVKRNARVKALAIVSRYPWISIFEVTLANDSLAYSWL